MQTLEEKRKAAGEAIGKAGAEVLARHGIPADQLDGWGTASNIVQQAMYAALRHCQLVGPPGADLRDRVNKACLVLNDFSHAVMALTVELSNSLTPDEAAELAAQASAPIFKNAPTV